MLYDKDRTKLMYYSMSNPAEEFVVPETVRTIGRSAFFGCENLKYVTVSSGVESISKGAFANCTNLSKVNIPGSVAHVDDWAFYGCTKLIDLSLPKNTVVGERAFSHSNVSVTLS